MDSNAFRLIKLLHFVDLIANSEPKSYTLDMKEREDTPEEIWPTLSEGEREACGFLAVPEWYGGVDENYFEAMGLNREDVTQLQQRGLLDARPAWEFAQEYLDQNRERVKDDVSILRAYQSQENVVRNKEQHMDLKYRLRDKSFYDFVRGQFNPGPSQSLLL